MPNALASTPAPENSFQALVDTASSVMQSGRYDEARKACHDLTETHPDQPNSWFLYGLSAFQSGDATAAIPALERAVAMHRANASYWRMLARALRAAGRNEQAAESLEHALRLEPDHPEALLTLGLIRAAEGQKDIGTKLSRRGISLGLKDKWRKARTGFALAFAPLFARAQRLARRDCAIETAVSMTCGAICERLENAEAALRYYQSAIETDPNYGPALASAGHLLIGQTQHARAAEYLELAAAQAPEDAVRQIDLATALNGMFRFEDAIEVLGRLFARGIETPRALIALGRAQTGAGDAAAAHDSFRKALNLAPNSADAHFALGRNLQDAGNIDEANRLFFETLAINPDHANAYRFLASNKALGVEHEAFDKMIDLLRGNTLEAESRSRLHFAAATVYEQAGDIENAFAHLSAGNELKNVIFDPDSCAAYFGRLIETYDADFFTRRRCWGHSCERPVFIVGMPRSGTSLVEQILASHSDVFGAGELEQFHLLVGGLSERLDTESAYPECISQLDADTVMALSTDHLNMLRDLCPDAHLVTDKMPTNFLHIGLILTMFPNARIIHCKRDPRDTCFSIYGLDFAGDHAYAYNQVNLGRFYRQYERLMDHWHRIAPSSILDIQYEDLVADQETHTRRMLDFCGLEWDESCLDFHKTDRTVRTWSYNQVRQPIYKSSVARWRKFEAHLAPLLAELDIRDAPERAGG